MKKILALLLALVMVMSLAACGGNETPATEAVRMDISFEILKVRRCMISIS